MVRPDAFTPFCARPFQQLAVVQIGRILGPNVLGALAVALGNPSRALGNDT